MTREGTRVRFEGSIHLPEDEICFFTFASPSGREAALVAQRAGLEPIRVVEAVPSGEENDETQIGAPGRSTGAVVFAGEARMSRISALTD